MAQMMQSLLHSRQPDYDICTPLWIIKLPAITLHPLTMYIDTTSMVEVLQIHIISSDTIIPAFAGWLRVRLYLPGHESRVGKIERHIWISEFIGRSDSITFVEYPVWMVGFPVGQIVVCTVVRECSIVTMKGDIVANIYFWIAWANCCNMTYCCSPYKIVVLRDVSR